MMFKGEGPERDGGCRKHITFDDGRKTADGFTGFGNPPEIRRCLFSYTDRQRRRVKRDRMYICTKIASAGHLARANFVLPS
jgi:hypothetical protein